MKYTIMHVNNRAEDNIKANKDILKNFEYVDTIEFIDGNTTDAKNILHVKGVKTSTWSPYDGRTSMPLPGEYGVLVSFLNLLEYVINDDTDSILLVEDDVVLSDNFVDFFLLCLNDLPKNYDFLSLAYPKEQNHISESTEMGSSYIHKADNQYAGNMVTLFSKSGAEKILKIVKRVGMEYNSDCLIYRYSRTGALNGFSIKPIDKKIVSHPNIIESVIDPKNLRNTDNSIV